MRTGFMLDTAQSIQAFLRQLQQKLVSALDPSESVAQMITSDFVRCCQPRSPTATGRLTKLVSGYERASILATASDFFSPISPIFNRADRRWFRYSIESGSTRQTLPKPACASPRAISLPIVPTPNTVAVKCRTGSLARVEPSHPTSGVGVKEFPRFFFNLSCSCSKVQHEYPRPQSYSVGRVFQSWQTRAVFPPSFHMKNCAHWADQDKNRQMTAKAVWGATASTETARQKVQDRSKAVSKG